MIKILIFLALGLVSIYLIKKLISRFTNNLFYQYIIYLITLLIFISFIFFFKENKVFNRDGSYQPPFYDGKNVIPGKVINEK